MRKYNDLTEEQQRYVDEYIRKTGETRERALRLRVVLDVLDEYENGEKERLIFA